MQCKKRKESESICFNIVLSPKPKLSYHLNPNTMKHVLLIAATLLLTGLSGYAQKAGKPKPVGIMNMQLIAETKFGPAENTRDNPPAFSDTKENSESRGTTTATQTVNTWNNFTSSMNIYGTTISFSKPLQWNDELNAVTFIHRKSPTYQPSPTPASNAENGSIVAMISADCGQTWDSTCIWTNDTHWARYPQGAIFNPPSIPTNTNINDAFVVACGPTTANGITGWEGNWYACKALGSVNYDASPSPIINAVQHMPSAGPYSMNLGKHDFSGYNFTATDDGKMRSLAGVTDDGNGRDTAVMLVTGTYNGTGGFYWSGTVFNPPTTTMSTDGTEQWVSRPMMAWNETGTIGYVVIIGARQNMSGSNVGFQPIVYKTINSGGSWTLENGIDFNSTAFADVKRPLITVSTDSTLEVPFFNWTEGMDCAVDANNKLHIFATVVGAASNHNDSTGFIRFFTAEGLKYPHVPGFRPYLYDFIYDGTNSTPNWSHITVDSMWTEGPSDENGRGGYQDNPWDADANNMNKKVRIDARLQLSRSPGGEYILYTWAESDTNLLTPTTKRWNTLPDIKARVFDVANGTVHPTEFDMTGTGPSNVAQHAMYHFISPKCKLASQNVANGPVIEVPLTISNSAPYSQKTKNKHWYSQRRLNFGNVPDLYILSCSDKGVGISDNSNTGLLKNSLYPNPAKHVTNLSVELQKSSEIRIEITNVVGQTVKIFKADGRAGENSIPMEVNDLSPGIYLVNVNTERSKLVKKLVVE
jgi:hypothetical protein